MFSKYFLKRLVALIPIFFGITILSFSIIHLTPGKPADLATELNVKVSLEARQRLNELYGLDDPIPLQYARWVKRLAVGDFGTSFHDGRAVSSKILERVPVTLGINAISLLIVLILCIPLGVVSAARRGSLFDRNTTTATFIAFSIPSFWLALILLSALGVHLRWVPVSGLHSLFSDRLVLWKQWLDVAHHLCLPILVLVVGQLAIFIRYVRGSMLDALGQDYIQTARAKGLPEDQILYRHALKNALLPLVTILGLSVPALLGGSVILESIFGIPGMGRLFFESVLSRDYPVIMGMVVISAVLTLLGNLLADVTYAIVDPRIRYEKS